MLSFGTNTLCFFSSLSAVDSRTTQILMAPPLTLQMEEIFIHKHVAMQPPLQLRAKETKRIFRYKNKLLLAYFHLCEQQKPLIVLFFSLLEH